MPRRVEAFCGHSCFVPTEGVAAKQHEGISRPGYDPVSLTGLGQEIFDLRLRAASGERVAAERNGHREFVPWRIGPLM
ncbi:MAG: UxaA family hydrolase [Bryobacteraceae bacterium]|nr:UxaA family hydrolase [Bryobacteraceae bacterium]